MTTKQIKEINTKLEKVTLTVKKEVDNSDLIKKLKRLLKGKNTRNNEILSLVEETLSGDKSEIKRMKFDETINNIRDIGDDTILLCELPEDEVEEEQTYFNKDWSICRQCGKEAGCYTDLCKCPCHTDEYDEKDSNGDDICNCGYNTDDEESEESEENVDKYYENEMAEDLKNDKQEFLLKDEEKEYNFNHYIKDEEEEDDENERKTMYAMIIDNLNKLYYEEENLINFFFPENIFNKIEIKNTSPEEGKKSLLNTEEEKSLLNTEEKSLLSTEEERFLLNSNTLKEVIKSYISFNDFSEFRISNSTLFIEYDVSSELKDTSYSELEFYNDMVDESLNKLDIFEKSKQKEITDSLKDIFRKINDIVETYYTKTETFPLIAEFIELHNRCSIMDNFTEDFDEFKNVQEEAEKINDEGSKLFEKLKKEHQDQYDEWRFGYNKIKYQLRAIDLIKEEQQNTDLIVNSYPMEAIIKEIMQNYNTTVTISDSAFEAIQTAAEEFLITRFQNANNIAISDGRTYISKDDMKVEITNMVKTSAIV